MSPVSDRQNRQEAIWNSLCGYILNPWWRDRDHDCEGEGDGENYTIDEMVIYIVQGRKQGQSLKAQGQIRRRLTYNRPSLPPELFARWGC